MKISINGGSTIFGLASWIIYVLQCVNNSCTILRQPIYFKQCMTHTINHHKTVYQRIIHNIESCILGNQGSAQNIDLIMELSTSVVLKHMMYTRKRNNSKIINIADYKICTKRLLAVEYLVLVIYNHPTAKTRTFINLQMDQLGNSLTTYSIQTGWKNSIKECLD
jgi:hypothetical protein